MPGRCSIASFSGLQDSRPNVPFFLGADAWPMISRRSASCTLAPARDEIGRLVGLGRPMTPRGIFFATTNLLDRGTSQPAPNGFGEGGKRARGAAVEGTAAPRFRVEQRPRGDRLHRRSTYCSGGP